MTEQAKRQREEPPPIESPNSLQPYYQIDEDAPLHKLFIKRMERGRDLKIIITADDSETGVGKTTFAGWLALQWNPIYTGDAWKAETHSCIDPNEFFRLQQNKEPGSVLILDDAEELDARRSMSGENVEFSHRWMLMRVRQLVQILTLPDPSSLDSRLEKLADVWINITRRGKGIVHDIRVQSYGSRDVMTPKIHEIEFPNVADHPELEKLREYKDERIESLLKEKEQELEEPPDPDEIRREQKIETAQKLRDSGLTIAEISNAVGMSEGWVSNNTEKMVEGVQ